MGVLGDIDYLRIAYREATNSTDPSTQNSALLLGQDGNYIVAVNRFPYGVAETSERWERPTKYDYIEHAERNVIYRAARIGFRTEGAVMYCPWFACVPCARAIVQSGIIEVIGHSREEETSNPRWDATVALGLAILKEAGVKIRYVKHTFGDLSIRRDGKIYRP